MDRNRHKCECGYAKCERRKRERKRARCQREYPRCDRKYAKRDHECDSADVENSAKNFLAQLGEDISGILLPLMRKYCLPLETAWKIWKIYKWIFLFIIKRTRHLDISLSPCVYILLIFNKNAIMKVIFIFKTSEASKDN